MGKTRDLFKKIRDTKGTFLVKMSTTKNRMNKIINDGFKVDSGEWLGRVKVLPKKKIFTTQIIMMV